MVNPLKYKSRFIRTSIMVKICTDSAGKPGGAVRIIESPQISNDIQPAVNNGNEPVLTGFRIQVFAGTDRAAAQKIKNEIAANYNEPAYMIYEAPYFKVRVGDFRNRIEAQQTFHALKSRYSDILLVPGIIKWPGLK
jgi:hypothetical protein